MATGTTEFVDKTIADAVFSVDVWTRKVKIARESKTVMYKLFNSVYESDAYKGRRVLIPSIGNLAARAKSENTAISFETIAETTTTVTINNDKYAAFAIEDAVAVQESIGIREHYRNKLGYALALQLDDDLGTLVASFSQNVGTLGVDPTDDDWLRALQYLDDADAPTDGRAIVISPAAKAGVLKLDKFTRSEYVGDGSMPVVTGALSREFYGAPVYVTTNVTANGAGKDSAFFQKESVGVVLQMKPRFHVFFDIDYFAEKIAAEELYGYVEVRDDHGVWVKTK